VRQKKTKKQTKKNDFSKISSDGRFQNTASKLYESFVSNQWFGSRKQSLVYWNHVTLALQTIVSRSLSVPVSSWTPFPIILLANHMHTPHQSPVATYSLAHYLDYKGLTHTPPHCEVLICCCDHYWAFSCGLFPGFRLDCLFFVILCCLPWSLPVSWTVIVCCLPWSLPVPWFCLSAACLDHCLSLFMFLPLPLSTCVNTVLNKACKWIPALPTHHYTLIWNKRHAINNNNKSGFVWGMFPVARMLSYWTKPFLCHICDLFICYKIKNLSEHPLSVVIP